MNYRKRILKMGYASIIFIVSIIFLLVFSYSTSPLYPYSYGWDSAFFQLVGKGMTKGYLPYRNFFDMKGPWLFFVQYVGACIGKYGIFLLQCIGLFMTLEICLKCEQIFLLQSSAKSMILRLLPLGMIMAITIEGGNLTEEWSLPLLFLCFYLALQYIMGEKKEHKILWGLIYGIAFGIISLIRITNTVLICAIVATVSISLITQRMWLNLIKNAIAFLGGVIISFSIPVLYFSGNGMLGEMFYDTFIFGGVYGTEGFGYGTGKCLILLLFLPIGMLIITRTKNRLLWLLAFFNMSGMLIVLGMGNSTLHDYMLVIPGMMLGIWIWKSNSKIKKELWKKVVVAAMFIGVFTYPCYKMIYVTKTVFEQNSEEVKMDYENIIEIAAEVRKKGGNEMWGYEVPLRVYLISEMMPYSRYCGWQEHYMKLMPTIKWEIIDMLEKNPPQWIVTKTGQVIDATIWGKIDKNYIEYKKNNDYTLYECREKFRDIK